MQIKFSHDEIEKWARGFQRDCPTGKLQKSEFVKIYNEFFPDGDATKFSQFVFDVFVMNVHQIFTFFLLQLEIEFITEDFTDFFEILETE